MEQSTSSSLTSPAYLTLLENGELARQADTAWQHMHDCDLCARYCHVDRFAGIKGAVCRTGERAVVNSYAPHHGEEDPLRGWNGSGTIFFSWCNLRCMYCQNWEISHKGVGRKVSPEEIADMMLSLQAWGCHNINLVSPSHVVAQIIRAVEIAATRGLRLPLVYNTGGYDSLEALALLDGIIDIYMPDMKYGDSAIARKYSRIRDYVKYNQQAVKEMHRQVGDLIIDDRGIAQRGLLIRHLVLPHGLAGTDAVLGFIASELSTDSYVNIMDQYRPCFHASEDDKLGHALTSEEYMEALRLAKTYGLERLDHRGLPYIHCAQ